MAYRPVPTRPIHLDHGRRQFAELSPLAEMARNSEAGSFRCGRSPRTQPLCRRQCRGPGAHTRPHYRTRGRIVTQSQATGLGLFARPEITAVLHRTACLAATEWNFPRFARSGQGWKESNQIAILNTSRLAGPSATNVKGNNL